MLFASSFGANYLIRFLSTTHERCNSRRPEGRQFTAIANSRTHSVQFTHAFACRTINIRAPFRARARARYLAFACISSLADRRLSPHHNAREVQFTPSRGAAIHGDSQFTHAQRAIHPRLCVPYNKYTRALPHALARNIPPLRAYPLSPTGVYPLTTTHERCNSRRPEGRQFTAIANSRTHSVQFTHAFACISSRLSVCPNKHKLRLTFIKKSLKITLLFKKGIDIVLCIKYTAIVKSR